MVISLPQNTKPDINIYFHHGWNIVTRFDRILINCQIYMGHEDTQFMNCRKLKMILIYNIFVDCPTESFGSFYLRLANFLNKIWRSDALQGAVQKNALHAALLSQVLIIVNQNFKLHQWVKMYNAKNTFSLYSSAYSLIILDCERMLKHPCLVSQIL